MKYLIIVQNYPPEIGPVRYTYDLANSLNEQGHSITVITGIPHYPSGLLYPEFMENKETIKNENGIKVIRTPLLIASNNQPVKRILGFITFFFSAIPHLLKNKDAQLLIVSIPPLNVLFLGILTKLFFRIPFIALLRDFEPYSTFNIRGLLKISFLLNLTKLISRTYKIADALVVVHSNQLDTIDGVGLTYKMSKVIPHPVELNRFNLKSKHQIKSNLIVKKRNLIGLYLGTFGIVHSLPQLIEVLILPQIGLLPIDFVFIGNGEDRIKCETLINANSDHNVTISEAIAFENVANKLQQADFLIYSQNSNIIGDTLGAKFSEYLASSKPILVCGKCPAMDIVKELGNGWTIESPNPEILYDSLKNILNDKSEFDNIGEHGLDYIKKYSSNNAFKEKWNDLCQSLIKTK